MRLSTCSRYPKTIREVPIHPALVSWVASMVEASTDGYLVQPSQACLHGLVGDVARAASADTETNSFAIATVARRTGAGFACGTPRGCFPAFDRES